MNVEKWWNEIYGRGKREKLRGKLTLTPTRTLRNPHTVIKTRTREGERRNAYAMEPPFFLIIFLELLGKLRLHNKID